METELTTSKSSRLFRMIILLAGAFTFAFLLGELVHDSGHYFAHLAYGNTQVDVHFDPFGGTHIENAGGLPNDVLGVTSLAGPLSDLVLALVVSLSLWRFRRPILLPLVLWGPVAMIQEGVTFSLGFLTPGGDAFWIAALGISKALILGFGVLILLGGVVGIAILLPIAGIKRDDSFGLKVLVLFLGMGSLMIIRFLYSVIAAPKYIIEDLVPLVFSLILILIVVTIHPKLYDLVKKNNREEIYQPSWKASLICLLMGAGMFGLQLLL